MRKRPYGPAWALLPAAALFAWSSLVPVAPVAAQAPVDLKPAASAPPATGSAVSILDAHRAGDLDVTIRGAGADHVKFTVTNKSDRRLNVVLPPGLVAAASTAQRGGGGGGFQSMGLGTPTDQPGRFGQFRGNAGGASVGFRSLPADSTAGTVARQATTPEGLGVGAGQTIEFNLPSVCLNFGAPTPTASNTFSLVSVDEYTQDVRARKALRSLATLGTSQGVAQAVVWNVFNGMTAAQMAREATKYLNASEISVASRFVEALDASSSHDAVDPAYFREGRVLVRVRGEGDLSKLADRLNTELQGTSIFGLPVQVVGELDAASARPASVLLDVMLSGGAGKVRGRTLVRTSSALQGWNRLGQVDLGGALNLQEVSGESLADVLDRAVAAQFVTVTPGRRGAGTVQFRVVNKLPLTLDDVVVRTGKDAETGDLVTLENLGVGPHRAAIAPIRAAEGKVERVTFNGL